MATQSSSLPLDIQEQIARIQKMNEETARLIQESRKIGQDTKVVPYATVFQGLIAVAALLGAGAALAKLLLP
jgi:hypothetical protein